MKTKGVRLHGADDIRLEEFELPDIGDDEILVKVVSDSICMSTWKLLRQGKAHKRCPDDIDIHPVIVGHETSGDIVQVGRAWQSEFTEGQKFALQPAINYQGSLASPGYSYQWFGGSAQYGIVPHEVMELGCLLHYGGESYFEASLGEPLSCIIGGYHSLYHTNKQNYDHQSGFKPGGNLLILGGAGPMGLGAVEYPLAVDPKPGRIVVTDLSDERLARACDLIPPTDAQAVGVELHYVNPSSQPDQYDYLMGLTDGHGYDDVMVFAPVRELAELGDSLLAFDGCLNFFAGPSQADFRAAINLYNCHYSSTHIMGTTGGNTDDLKEGLALAQAGAIRPAVMVTHVGGIDAIVDSVTRLPQIPGGKKLTYPHIELPLTAITDFARLGQTDPLFAQLAQSVESHLGLWNAEAEQILLSSRLAV